MFIKPSPGAKMISSCFKWGLILHMSDIWFGSHSAMLLKSDLDVWQTQPNFSNRYPCTCHGRCFITFGQGFSDFLKHFKPLKSLKLTKVSTKVQKRNRYMNWRYYPHLLRTSCTVNDTMTILIKTLLITDFTYKWLYL